MIPAEVEELIDEFHDQWNIRRVGLDSCPYPNDSCWCRNCAQQTAASLQRQAAEEARQWAEAMAQSVARDKEAADRYWAERAAWLATPAGQAELAREKEKALQQKAEVKRLRAEMLQQGPYDGPAVAEHSDPVEAYRRLIAWASSNDTWDDDAYGRLFIVRRGYRDILHEMRDAGDGNFTLTEVKTLAQVDAYLARNNLHVSFLPDEECWARWFRYDIPEAARQQAWADQYWPGAWRLKGAHQLPFKRSDGSEVEWAGYDVQTGFWALPAPEQLALEPARPTTLAGQLAEISMARDFIGSMTDIAAELLRCFGGAWSSKGLQCAIKRDAAELELHGVTAKPTGRTIGPTSRAEWIVRGKNNALNARNALTS